MAWPASLPELSLVTNYLETHPDGSYRTEMDSGPAKTRPRPDTQTAPISETQIMTAAQIATLLTYYDTTLNKGSASDTDTHPRTGSSFTYRFASGIRWEHMSGPLYRVSFTLEILP